MAYESNIHLREYHNPLAPCLRWGICYAALLARMIFLSRKALDMGCSSKLPSCLMCPELPLLETGMNSMKLVIPLQLLYWSIHTKDESKRGTAFAFIFGVN